MQITGAEIFVKSLLKLKVGNLVRALQDSILHNYVELDKERQLRTMMCRDLTAYLLAHVAGEQE